MASKELKYSISADASKYERAMSRIKESTQSAEAVANKAFGAIGIAIAAAGGAFLLAAKKTITMGDEIHKLNLRLGISTETLSELRHVANLSGVNFNTVAKSYQKMGENISDANQGIGTAKDSIKALGLNIGYLMSLKPDRQFEAIADAMQGISNQSDKVRIAADIFGGRGVEMLQIMTKGAAGIREMRKEAEDLGLTLSQEGANRIAAVNDAFTRFKGAIMGVVQASVVQLAPTIINILDWLGTKIPIAVDYTVKAFNAIPAIVAIIVNKAVSALIFFYDVLGKVPLIGEPYRDAAAALREFSLELDNFAAAKIMAMETMPAQKINIGIETQGEEAKSALGIPSQEKMQEELDLLMSYSESVLEYKKQRAEAEKRIEEQRERDIKATEDRILAYKQQMAANQISVARSIFTAGLQIAGVEGKKLFMIQKAIDVGMAIQAAYRAYTLALAVPPAPNYALATMALKSGLWGAAAIAATAIGQMTAGGSTGGGTYTSPMVTTPAETETLPKTEEGTQKPSITFIVEGDFIGDETYVENFIEKINNAVEDRDVTLIATNAQNAQYAEALI